mmetsp:Transcript_5880/g.11618  ORF Transcript_5880/g.11618 Transcript_5880/m.11618 type:complete len:230 (-) Transcript_5880:1047-1736(-)
MLHLVRCAGTLSILGSSFVSVGRSRLFRRWTPTRRVWPLDARFGRAYRQRRGRSSFLQSRWIIERQGRWMPAKKRVRCKFPNRSASCCCVRDEYIIWTWLRHSRRSFGGVMRSRSGSRELKAAEMNGTLADSRKVLRGRADQARNGGLQISGRTRFRVEPWHRMRVTSCFPSSSTPIKPRRSQFEDRADTSRRQPPDFANFVVTRCCHVYQTLNETIKNAFQRPPVFCK